MNTTALYLVDQHGGPSLTALPGDGFDNLTPATGCTYLLDSDYRIISAVLETTADEPIDEVCDFFVQQIALAVKPSPSMQEMGIGRLYGDVLIVRMALDGVPEWQREVIQQRIGDVMNVIGTTHTYLGDGDGDEG